MYGGIFEAWLYVQQGWEGMVFIVIGGGGVCFHFLDMWTLVGASSGLGFCGRGNIVRCIVASTESFGQDKDSAGALELVYT